MRQGSAARWNEGAALLVLLKCRTKGTALQSWAGRASYPYAIAKCVCDHPAGQLAGCLAAGARHGALRRAAGSIHAPRRRRAVAATIGPLPTHSTISSSSWPCRAAADGSSDDRGRAGPCIRCGRDPSVFCLAKPCYWLLCYELGCGLWRSGSNTTTDTAHTHQHAPLTSASRAETRDGRPWDCALGPLLHGL